MISFFLNIQLAANNNDLKQLQFAYNYGIALLKNLSLIGDSSTFILEKPTLRLNEDSSTVNLIQK
jgi:energy-converting hydrogenase Eha subunit H